MKKLTLTLLLFSLISTNAFAEWTKVGTNEDGDYYMDLQTIQNEGNKVLAFILGYKVKVWVLNDYKFGHIYINGMNYFSDEVHYEYDCEEKTYQVFNTKSFAGHMGSGSLIGSVIASVSIYNSGTEEIVPGSINEIRFKKVCEKKREK